MIDKIRPLWPWNNDEREALEAEAKQSVFSLVGIGIAFAVGLVGFGIMKLINIFREL